MAEIPVAVLRQRNLEIREIPLARNLHPARAAFSHPPVEVSETERIAVIVAAGRETIRQMIAKQVQESSLLQDAIQGG